MSSGITYEVLRRLPRLLPKLEPHPRGRGTEVVRQVDGERINSQLRYSENRMINSASARTRDSRRKSPPAAPVF